MKKSTFALALAAAACMAAGSYAKVIPGEGNTVSVKGKVTTVANGGNLVWNSFDLDKGYTVKFTGAESHNTITSKKASSLKGTIDAANNVYFYNANGFSIANTFTFTSTAGATFGLGLSQGSALSLEATGKKFKLDSGTMNIGKTGIISGAANFGKAFDLTSFTLNGNGQNVTVGDITSSVTGTMTISGKDVRTGNLDSTNGNFTITAEGSITTKNYTNASNGKTSMTAGKNITMGNFTSKTTNTTTLEAGATVKIGDVEFKASESSFNVTAATISTGKLTTGDEIGETTSTLTATNSITMGDIKFRGSRHTLNLTASSMNIGKIDISGDSSITATANTGATAFKFGDTIIKGSDAKMEVKGTVTTNVTFGNIEANNKSTLNVTGKNIITGSITAEQEDAAGTDNITTLTLAAYNDISTGALKFKDFDTNTVTANFTGGHDVKTGKIDLNASTATIYGKQSTTVGDVAQNAGTLTLGSEDLPGAVTTGKVSVNDGEFNLYADTAKITSIVKNAGTVSVTADDLTVGDVTSASSATFVVANSARFGNIVATGTFAIEGYATKVMTGTVLASSYGSFGIDAADATLSMGKITIDNQTAVSLKANKITLAGITTGSSVANGISVTAADTLAMGVINLTNTSSSSNTFTAENNITFTSIDEGTTVSGITVTSNNGNISGGNITSAAALEMEATNGNLTAGNVKFVSGYKNLHAGKTLSLSSLEDKTNRGNTLSAKDFVIKTLTNSNTHNSGLVLRAEDSVTVKTLVNTNNLTVEVSENNGYFTSDNMTEEGTSVFRVDRFTAKNYASTSGSTTHIQNCTKGFTIGTSVANGTIKLNVQGNYIDVPSNILINKGAYFNNLLFSNQYTVTDSTAAKKITARNFNEDTSWK